MPNSGVSSLMPITRDVDLRLVLGNLFSIHLLESIYSHFDIMDKSVASALAEILTNNNTHKLELVTVRSHGVRRNNPTEH